MEATPTPVAESMRVTATLNMPSRCIDLLDQDGVAFADIPLALLGTEGGVLFWLAWLRTQAWFAPGLELRVSMLATEGLAMIARERAAQLRRRCKS